MFEEYNNGVPDRLRQVTAETMSPEALYTLDTYSDVSPQDVIYIDESRAEGSGRLIISKGQSVKLLEEADLSTPDRVILMSVWQRNDQGDLCRGIVADCRFYSGRFDVEYGDEEIDDEIYNKDDEQVISAVVDYGDDGAVKIWGDPTFFDAARYMAGLVDNESIEKNEVIAGSRETQDSVSDGESRERVNDNSGTSSDPFYKRALNGLAKIVKARRK